MQLPFTVIGDEISGMRKFVSACLLVFLLLGLIGNFLPLVEANPDFVTETSTEITIENDYYKAIFDKDPSNGHGRIRYFYIKPDTTNSIIPDNIWKMFAGHEIVAVNGTTVQDPRDWAVSSVENFTMTVEYNSGGTAIVSCDKWFKTYAEGWYQAQIVSYWAFYENKPYYLEYHKRVYIEDFSWTYNSDICYFFNDTWVSTYKTLGEDGTILTDDQPEESLQIHEAVRLNKYPWAWFYNTTAELGIGLILLSANPTSTRLWSYYLAAGQYIEAQVAHKIEGVKAGQTGHFTMLTYVTNDYTKVNSLAEDLCSDTQSTETFLKTVQINENKPTTGVVHGDFSTPNNIWMEPMNAIFSPWYYGYRGSYLYGKYKNSTNTYDVLIWDSLTWEDWSWNGSYGTVTLQNDFESKIRIRWKLEFWNDSDAMRHTLNFTTLAACNIEALYLRCYESLVATNTKRLNGSVIKQYEYGGYYEPWIEEIGTAYQNLSGCVTNERLSTDASFYALNQTESEIASGQSYVMEIKQQIYYRLDSEGLGEFDENDMLEFHQSNYSRFNVLRWNKFPLHENRDFKIKHYGFDHFIGASVYDGSDTLSFVICGESGTTSTIQIYVGSKAKPTYILNSPYDLNDYDPSSKILNLSTTHTSAESITVGWNSFDGIYIQSTDKKISATPTYADDKFTFSVSASTGQTSTIEVYCANKGEPSSVEGASSHSYDLSTKICTITVTHLSEEQVEVNWSEAWTRLKQVYAIIYATVPLLGLIAVVLIAGGVIYAFKLTREMEWS